MNVTDAKQVRTGEVRLFYAHIWEPKANEDGKLKYSVCISVPKTDTATIARLQKGINTALEEALTTKFGGKRNGLKTPLRDGDEERPDSPEYAGMMFFNCSTTQKPIILDRDKNPVLDRTEVYSGCWAEVLVNFYAYSAPTAKGIAAGLRAIRKTRDDEAFGGGMSESEAASAFGDLDDDI